MPQASRQGFGPLVQPPRPGTLAKDNLYLSSYLTVAPTNNATPDKVVCAAFNPNKKSLSE